MRLPDLTPAQQAAAIDRTGENISLTSGAGCGKTFVLARRFTELLMTSGSEDPLSRLVAVTFTEKAALEMRQRVRALLRTLADGARREDRTKLLRWIEELPEARISTIHSFCSSLLRTCAIEAGIDPSFSVCADELLSSRLTARSAEEAVLAAVEGGDQRAAHLVGELGLARLCEHLTALLGMRTRTDLADYADTDATLAHWRQQLEADRTAAWAALERDGEIFKLIDRIAAIPCDDPEDKLARFREEKLALARGLVQDRQLRRPRFFEAMAASPGNVGSKKVWGKDVPKQVRDLLKDLAARFEPYAPYAEDLSAVDERAAETLATLTGLALDAQEELRSRMGRRGLLSFDDLLLLARRLVDEHPSIRCSLSRGIDQMLIDESQDTDAFQLSLLLGILFDSDDLAGIPAGRLFLVGDAKQSIYRFRGAQVDVFRDICRRLGEQQRESLDISFRTHRAGIEFVNHLFSDLMSEDYRAIRAHRTQPPPEPAVEVLLAGPGKDDGDFRYAEETVNAQAAVTADRIERMVNGREKRVWNDDARTWRPVEFGDVAILFSRMTNSLAFERELARRSLPYYVVAGTGFFQQQEVYDVLNVLRAIANPLDDVAVFGVLRSSLVAVDDNTLTRLAETCDRPYLPALLAGGADRAELDEADRAAVSSAVEWMDRLHRKASAMGIDELLEDVLERTGYEGVLLTRPQGRRLVGNVRRVVDLARAAQADGLSLGEFVTQMNEQVLNQQRAEQACVAGESENVIRLMTIHQAKGLEFPVVVLPDLNAGRQKPNDRILHRCDWGITTAITTGPGEEDEPDPLSHRLSLQAEQADAVAEDLRRLYVAVTRHEDYLVFVGADWRTKDGRIKAGDSDLAILDEALGITDALDAGRETISYGNGEFCLRVGVQPRPTPPGRRGTLSPGRKLLAQADDEAGFADDLIGLVTGSGKSPPLLGPLTPSIGRAELAVTALSEFARCPQLYRYRYELRMPELPSAASAGAADIPSRPETGLSPMTLGTVYHRCMELLDFDSPQPAGGLVAAVAGELDLTDQADLEALREELAAMLDTLRGSPLLAALRGASRTLRELDFLMDVDSLRLRGQIDLLLRGADGAWQIVDYKSDRLNPDETWADRAGKYVLQLQAYALAAEGHLGEPPAAACLYSLRTGETWETPLADLAAAREDLLAVGRELIASRRSGTFAARTGPQCEYCPYSAICPGGRSS